MNNMSGLLQQAQQMQKKMLEVEKKLKETEVIQLGRAISSSIS